MHRGHSRFWVDANEVGAFVTPGPYGVPGGRAAISSNSFLPTMRWTAVEG
jgi:hypothetical protein